MTKELKDRLIEARELRGLSQGEIAKQVGVTQPTYSDLETGESKSSRKLVEIAHVLGVDAYALKTGEGWDLYATSLEATKQRVFAEIQQLPQSEQDELLAYIVAKRLNPRG